MPAKTQETSSPQPSPFSQLIGNHTAKSCLEAMVQKKTVPSVLLFHGTPGIGKKAFATSLALALLQTNNTSHPDLHIYLPEGTTRQHTMESMKELLHEVGLAPFSAPYKVFIIEDAERMLASSSNALLKTLEEPPPQAYIFLLSSEPEKLLPTIASRTRKIPFFPISEEEISAFLTLRAIPQETAQKCAILSQGSLAKALRLSTEQIPLPIEQLMQATSHTELLAILSTLEEPSEDNRHEYADRIFEEILFWIREHNPLLLESSLQQISASKTALQHHIKLKNILEVLCTKISQKLDLG